MANGAFEVEETAILKYVIRDYEVVINIGANVGYYCCLALSLGRHVVAFEPAPLNVKWLLKNIRANKWDERIEVFPLALSDRIGSTQIYGGGTGASLIQGWAGTSVSFVDIVPVSTLDIVVGTRFRGRRTLVIVDIEGAENLMLQGACKFENARPKPVWFVEISVSQHQPHGVSINPHLLETFSFFFQKGYEAWTANNECRQVFFDEVRNIIATGINTFDCHNFWFVGPEQRHSVVRGQDKLDFFGMDVEPVMQHTSHA